MFKIYEDLFYTFYNWNVKRFGEDDVPEWKALLVLTVVMSVHLNAIGLLLEIFGVISFYFKKPSPKYLILLISGIILIINYLIFVYKGKYYENAKKHASNSIKKTHPFILIMFTILSMFVPFCIGLIGALLKN